jgi:hypothetical protein
MNQFHYNKMFYGNISLIARHVMIIYMQVKDIQWLLYFNGGTPVYVGKSVIKL